MPALRPHAFSVRALLLALPLGLVACKSARGKLEKLVPDGATAIISVDAKAIIKTDTYESMKGSVETIAAAQPSFGLAMARLEDDCDIDYEKTEAYVIGIDALSKGFMLAVRMPNAGKKSSLECIDELIAEQGPDAMEVSEEDGKARVEMGDGEVVGWAIDDDTLVLSSKGWSGAVKNRIDGEGEAAIDENLESAVKLADTDAHIWFAAKVPSIAGPLLEGTAGEGLEMVAGSMSFGDDTKLVVKAGYETESQADAAKGIIEGQLKKAGPMLASQGMPTDIIDSVDLDVDDEILEGKMDFPIKEIVETTNEAFTKYTRRAKTSEARIQLAKMFDAASSYFMEEHIERGDVMVLGAGGSISDAAPHKCPNNGKAKGRSGVVPPLKVDCTGGPDGKCVPKAGGGNAAKGEYDMALWTDNDVFNGLNFQQEQGHVFHYQFKWANGLTGFGDCQFTAQAFADLDGDGVFSTYERSGAADQNGVNAAAGLYIDQEVE